MTLPRVPKKVLPNRFARESETASERAYWMEAKDAIEQLCTYVRIAKAYHFGEKLADTAVAPLSADIRKLALRFYDAEQTAIAIRVARAERKKMEKEG